MSSQHHGGNSAPPRSTTSAISLTQQASRAAISSGQHDGMTFGLSGIPAMTRLVLDAFDVADPEHLPDFLHFLLLGVEIDPSLVRKELTSYFALEAEWQSGKGNSRDNSLQVKLIQAHSLRAIRAHSLSTQLWKVLDGNRPKVEHIQLCKGLIAIRLSQLFRVSTLSGVTYANGLLQLLRAVHTIYQFDLTPAGPPSETPSLLWSFLIVYALVNTQQATDRANLGLTHNEAVNLHLQLPEESEYRQAITFLVQAFRSETQSTNLNRLAFSVSVTIYNRAMLGRIQLGGTKDEFANAIFNSLQVASRLLQPLLIDSHLSDTEQSSYTPSSTQQPIRKRSTQANSHKMVRDWKAARAKRGGGGRSAGRDFREPEENDNPFSLDNTKDSSSEDDSDDSDEESGDESDGFGGTISKKSKPKTKEEEAKEEEELAKSLGGTNLASTSSAPPPSVPSTSAPSSGRGLGERKVVKTPEEIARLREAKKVEKKPVSSSDSPKNLNKGAPVQMSRREREEKEKAAARERYMALHAAGKTDEAKKDMARLAAIRKQREAQKAAKDKEAADKEAARTAALAKSGRKIAK
ncbi:PDGFA associated 1 family protein [Sporobolomyces salmoneus]|uniref:PDGFA associated 1 family protein n=1 Tax=Sporobolomyces salmoneus TaxID=183962 RepID=UPI00317A0076